MKYLKYVNVKMGTASTRERSCGNTNPIVARPFGMNHFIPQTRDINGGWLYHPSDIRTTGIRLTHVPSPWLGDYARIIMMPTSGNKDGVALDGNRQSSYDVKNSILSPAYMKLHLIRYGVTAELVPTVRGGILRSTWSCDCPKLIDGGETHRFLLDFSAEDREKNGERIIGATADIDFENGIVKGYTNNFRRFGLENLANNFRMYFVFDFGAAINKELSVIKNGVVNLAFCGSPEMVECRFATSFISLEQAQFNLKTEVSDFSLEQLKKQGEIEWESYLSRIEIKADAKTTKTFYSCLYRTFLFPRIMHEICPDGSVRHFSAMNGKICDGYMYVDNGFWDTYKTVYPLYSLIASDKYEEMCKGFVNHYKEGGWLPRWTSPCAVNCMPGTAIDAVFGDAAVKGVITDKSLLSDMLEALLKHADNCSDIPAVGRDGLEAYKSLGYVSNEYHESINKTLDYAYGDFCISKVADALGKTEISARLMESALNYQNLFDKETGFMRSKDRNGNMRNDFTEFDWGSDYTEGGPWQNSFAVYQDLLGYAKLLGGRKQFLDMIQKLFDTPPYFREYGYGKEIHEMTEMVLLNGFGQCALSNQPSFHVPYLFSCMGDRDRSAYWVKKCVSELFKADPEGFPGDEDNGSMATWYVFSALGFYPVCPGAPEYVIAAPSVKSAVIHLDNGNDLTVSAFSEKSSNVYAKTVSLNGKKHKKVFITQNEIKNGGSLDFEMSSEPSGQTYTDAQLPYSISK